MKRDQATLDRINRLSDDLIANAKDLASYNKEATIRLLNGALSLQKWYADPSLPDPEN